MWRYALMMSNAFYGKPRRADFPTKSVVLTYARSAISVTEPSSLARCKGRMSPKSRLNGQSLKAFCDGEYFIAAKGF